MTDRSIELQVQVPKPDVVITSFEALVSDASALKALSWDVVVVDERTRMASALSRAYQALYGVHCRARAIVAHPSLLKTVSSASPAYVRPMQAVTVRRNESSLLALGASWRCLV